MDFSYLALPTTPALRQALRPGWGSRGTWYLEKVRVPDHPGNPPSAKHRSQVLFQRSPSLTTSPSLAQASKPAGCHGYPGRVTVAPACWAPQGREKARRGLDSLWVVLGLQRCCSSLFHSSESWKALRKPPEPVDGFHSGIKVWTGPSNIYISEIIPSPLPTMRSCVAQLPCPCVTHGETQP